jgi:hypothetical protein
VTTHPLPGVTLKLPQSFAWTSTTVAFSAPAQSQDPVAASGFRPNLMIQRSRFERPPSLEEQVQAVRTGLLQPGSGISALQEEPLRFDGGEEGRLLVYTVAAGPHVHLRQWVALYVRGDEGLVATLTAGANHPPERQEELLAALRSIRLD